MLAMLIPWLLLSGRLSGGSPGWAGTHWGLTPLRPGVAWQAAGGHRAPPCPLVGDREGWGQVS